MAFHTILTNARSWGEHTGLYVVLLGLGATLIGRAIGAGAHWTEATLARSLERAEVAGRPTESFGHLRAVTQATRWALTSLVFFLAFVLALLRLGVPLASLIAPATVVGIAVGFGAQQLVGDVLAGFFLFAERQFGVGDEIRVSAVGATTGVTGTVEELTLRVTKLRTAAGELVILTNGEMLQITNLSRGWAQVTVDLPIAPDVPVAAALQALDGVASRLADAPELAEVLLAGPDVVGVEAIGAGYMTLRMTARTRPGGQATVARRLRQEAVAALQAAGVPVGPATPPTPGSSP